MKKRFLSIVLILSIILSFNTIISFAGTLEEDDVINENNIELYLRIDDAIKETSSIIVRVKNKTGKAIILSDLVCENHSWYAADGSRKYTIAANEEKNLVFYSSDTGILSTRKYNVMGGSTAGINIQYLEPVEGHPVTLKHRCLFNYHGIKSFYDDINKEKEITVTLDGKALSFDVPPQIINNRTMVPLRAIFEALGASVDWNQETKTVTSTKGDTTIKLTIDSNTMYVNGNTVTLDTPACVVNDRTLVPVRAISEAYKTKVDWNGDTKTVIISNINSESNEMSQSTSTSNIEQSSENAYTILKQYIMTEGTYIEEQKNFGFFEKTGYNQDICFVFTPEPEYAGIIYTYEKGNYTAQVIIQIHENTQPSALVKITSNITGGEQMMLGEFSTTDNKFHKTEGNVPSEQNAMNVLNSLLSYTDDFLKNHDIGITLIDLGIAY